MSSILVEVSLMFLLYFFVGLICSFVGIVFILNAHQSAVAKNDEYAFFYDRVSTYSFSFIALFLGILWPLFLSVFIVMRLANLFLKKTRK